MTNLAKYLDYRNRCKKAGRNPFPYSYWKRYILTGIEEENC